MKKFIDKHASIVTPEAWTLALYESWEILISINFIITQNYFQFFPEDIDIIYNFYWNRSFVPQLTPREFYVSLA